MTRTTRDTRIAFIGIGLMGSRMAARLLDAGFAVAVWNRSGAKCDPLVDRGARRAASVADAVADADVAITMLAGAPAIEHVYFGADGIVGAAPRSCLLVDMSSVAPDIAQEMHRRLAEAGYAHLDAPVSGGVSGAEAGTLAIMAGGAAGTVQRARPVLETMGTVFHLGDGGAGQVCKLVNQTIVHVTIGAVTEGLMLAASLGVDAAKVREAIGGGYCQSRILEIQGEKMIARDFVPWPTAAGAASTTAPCCSPTRTTTRPIASRPARPTACPDRPPRSGRPRFVIDNAYQRRARPAFSPDSGAAADAKPPCNPHDFVVRYRYHNAAKGDNA